MRFLSFANNEEDAEKAAKLKEAAAKIEKAMAKEKVLSELIDYKEEHQSEQEIDPANDTRSLYERLQEQRNKKKEDLEESKKLSNWIAQLDDDDVEYLNEVAKKKQEDELRRKLEMQDALEAKKRIDEQKMLAEERKMRESLLGKSPQTTKTKSRLSALIKMKPKAKTNDLAGHHSTNTAADQTDKSSTSKQLSSSSAEAKPSQSTTPQETPQDRAIDSSTKTTQDQTNKDKPVKKEDRDEPSHEAPQCTCSKDVMTSIGVLPSLPIIRDNRDSSDQDSDCSDDNLYGRLVPRSRKRRK